MDAQTVDMLVDAYQDTLRSSRESFGTGSESRVVVAAVVENARAARQHLVTSVPGGDRLTSRLDTFLTEAEKMDDLGRWFAQARTGATSAAKQVVDWAWKTAAGLSALPTVPAVFGAVLAVSGALREFGRVLGGIIAVVIAGAAALIMRNPGQATRIGLTVAQQLPQGVQSGLEWSDRTFTSAVGSANNLGRGAETLLQAKLHPAASTFFGNRLVLPGWDVAGRTRSAAKGVLYTAVGLIAVCVVVIGFGIADGLNEAAEDGRLNPTPTTTDVCDILTNC